ncbi:MAG: hypothetical protein HUJ68_12920 [Clostridia bacterium]|nr:hypothetical protein [Clostridia bacterium]
MKRNLLYIFFICFTSLLYSQNFDKNGKILDLNNLYYDINLTSDIKFSEGKMIVRDYDIGLKENNYVISSDNIIQKYESSLTYVITNSNEKFLLLANSDLLIIYDEHLKTPKIFAMNLVGQDEFIDFINPNSITASSELKEGSKLYSGKNISNLNISEPWVENAEGHGIGEFISFYGNCTFLYILNGYISFEKPYLYEANSRLKKIEISFPEEINKNSLIVELNDTPNPQKIDLGFRCQSQICLKILEVYEGLKYKDTCLSGILMKVY